MRWDFILRKLIFSIPPLASTAAQNRRQRSQFGRAEEKFGPRRTPRIIYAASVIISTSGAVAISSATHTATSSALGTVWFPGTLIFKPAKKHQKWLEIDAESTARGENQSRSMPGALGSISDRSCGQKKIQKCGRAAPGPRWSERASHSSETRWPTPS